MEPVLDKHRCIKIGYKQLNDFQKEALKECLVKKSAGLSLPMGSGKTLISTVLSLMLTEDINEPILVVCSKTLVMSWKTEIKKFFKDKLIYETIDQLNVSKWKIGNTQFILTTIDVLSKCYKLHNINNLFVQQHFNARVGYTNFYNSPTKPFLTHNVGGGLFFSINWGCLIVDEAQVYTNINTMRCQSLGALYCRYRWLLSGTLFDEPKAERILGYHVILSCADKPKSLPDTKILLCSDKFKGLNEHLVHRSVNLAFIPPKLHDEIITHKLSEVEGKIYIMMKQILIEVRNQAERAKLLRNKEDFKRLSSYKLVMIMYLRQCLLCSLIPITSVVINASDVEKKNELSGIIMRELHKLDLGDYLNNTNSMRSTRIQSVITCLNRHKDEKVIVFSCFRSFLDILHYLLKDEDRPLFFMIAEMSGVRRDKLIQSFRESDNGVLILTFDIGCMGLNLQFASTVLLVDFWWNNAKSQQAIARVFRFGQLSDVNTYFFSSNTAVENIIFQKQHAKLQILNELKTGKQESKIPPIKIDNIIRLIDLESNKAVLDKVIHYKK
jgi:SNF2 family DNA or RNA helicase